MQRVERLSRASGPYDSRERQDILNQPWEFEEVVLSPKEVARVRRGPAGNALFEQSGALVVSEFRLRELAVRLRTINNACDSGAQLPDGRPITEVSLYGSRDRQYLVGPYFAVRRLMNGVLPASDMLTPALTRAHEEWSRHSQLLLQWWQQLKESPDTPWPLPLESLQHISPERGFSAYHSWNSVPSEKRFLSWNHLLKVWRVGLPLLETAESYLRAPNPYAELMHKLQESVDLQKAKGQWWFTFYADYETLREELRALNPHQHEGANAMAGALMKSEHRPLCPPAQTAAA